MIGMNDLGETGAPAAANLAIDVTTANFREEVLARSARTPVLVEFWSPRSGPSKQLAQNLEKVAKAAGDKIRWARIDIEQHPEIAGQLGVQSIPAVIAFQKGQPLDGFAGVLPPNQMRAFVERLVGPIGGEADDLIVSAEAALADGDAAGAALLFSEALAFDLAEPRAIAGLAKSHLAAGDLESAEAALAMAAAPSDSAGPIAAARAAIDLAKQAEKVGDFGALEREIAADPKNYQARFDLALALNAAGRRDEAADSLIEIIRLNRAWNEDAARKQLLQLFEAWGHMEPETITARRKLSVLLYS